MTNKTTDRNEELVAFFVAQCQGLGRTRLMKLLYLADYEARRYLGRPLSTLAYKWHYYGPFDSSVETVIEKLKADGAVTETSVIYPNGTSGYMYGQGPNRLAPSFQPSDLAVLGYVCKKYSAVSLRELLDDIVYKTEPMEAAQKAGSKGGPLNMAMVDNKKANELGTSFEVLLQRSWDLRAGRGLSHEQAMQLVEQQLGAVA